VYYKRAERETVKGWLLMAIAAVKAFIITFKLVLSQLVQWTGNGMGWLYVIILAAGIAGIVYSQRERKPILNLSLWGALLIFLGYSTSTLVLVRAGQDPPMIQNAPADFKRLAGYINRVQYGEAKELPRRLEE